MFAHILGAWIETACEQRDCGAAVTTRFCQARLTRPRPAALAA